MRYRLAERYN